MTRKHDRAAGAAAGEPAGDGGEAFEELVDKLEEIVDALERGELPLEASMRQYEEGVALVRRAQARLDGMSARLTELLADGQQRDIRLPTAAAAAARAPRAPRDVDDEGEGA